jgi:hypothetical protein
MKTILELWEEIQQHPDFVTGRIHTKDDVRETLESHIDEEDFNRISELFVEENKEQIAGEIDSFELDNYQYCSWVDNLEDLIETGTKKIFAYDSEIA